MDKAELKAKVREVIYSHLKSKGYPEMNQAQILAELKPIWIKLEESQLIQRGWSYPAFVHCAQQAAMFADLLNAFRS